MARIFHNDDWYDELGPGSLYEAEFERIFKQYVPRIYPGFVAVPFKKTVSSDYSSARADLALIRADYLGWWVVEIERAVHSLSGHVLPQIRTLATAYYGQDEARYLASQSNTLEEARLFDMIRGEQPRVLVVVDMPRETWRAPLQENNAELAVFQLFRSERGRYVVRLNGYQPTISESHRSLCSLDPILSNLMRISTPAILPAGENDRISIYYQGKLTLWRRIETADCVWLRPLARFDLDTTARYELVRDAGRLLLQRTEPPGR